jgi:uncharacterized membrane protein
MSDSLFSYMVLFTTLGCGLLAGVFFAFSTFVMKALGRLPPSQGIAAMKSINVTVINPWFMTVFLGMAATCMILVSSALVVRARPGAIYLLIGGLFYLVGTFLITVLFNVPWNDALAAVKADSAEGAKLWGDYLSSWAAWNHVRTITALVAATLFSIVCSFL